MSETIINGIIEESQEIFGKMQYARGAKGDDGIGISDISKTSTVGKVDTYTITLTDGTTKTFTVTNGDDGANGISVSTASINSSGHLILTLSNGTSIDAGVASEVYIGTTPPTDPSIKVWIDTSGEAGDVEMTSNKVTSISSESTDIQYPSAKAVANIIGDIDATFANALKGTASGSVLALNDVSPAEHTMEVKVRGKNLIPYPYAYTTQTINGITFTDNGDGTITANGTATSLAIFRLVSGDTLNIGSGTFTLSGCPIGGSLETYCIQIYNTNSLAYNDTGSGIKLTCTKQDNWNVAIFIDRNTTVENLVFKPQLESGSTASEYTPYISDYTAVPEKQWQQVFSSYCEFSGSSMEFYLAPVYKPKTFDIVVGKEYTLETSRGMQGPNGLKYTCTAVANSYGGYSIKCDVIRVETCSEEYAQQMISAGRPEYSEWIDKFRIAWVSASYSYVDFTLTIKEYAGDITKAVKLIKTNADGTVSEEYTPTADGTVNGVTSLYPCTKLSTNVDDIVIECAYNRDINKAFEELQRAIISLGGNV